MRTGNQRHRLHGLDAQNPEVGLPALELEQRVMVEAQPDGEGLSADGLVEHATERPAVHGHGLHPKADDPAGKLIHDDQDPMTPQQDRIGPEQVHAPETVFGMTQERKPRRSVVTAFGVVVRCQNSADHILVDLDAKALGQVLCHLWAAKTGIALLEFTDGSDEFRCGPFWTWLLLRT